MQALWRRLQGASEGGTPTGLHGTGIVSVTVLPANEQLSVNNETVVEATSDLAFRVAILNSGDSQEVGIKVTLTIQKSPEPITQTKTIQLINAGETKTVDVRGPRPAAVRADDAGEGDGGARPRRVEHLEQQLRVPRRLLAPSLA